MLDQSAAAPEVFKFTVLQKETQRKNKEEIRRFEKKHHVGSIFHSSS